MSGINPNIPSTPPTGSPFSQNVDGPNADEQKVQSPIQEPATRKDEPAIKEVQDKPPSTQMQATSQRVSRLAQTVASFSDGALKSLDVDKLEPKFGVFSGQQNLLNFDALLTRYRQADNVMASLQQLSAADFKNAAQDPDSMAAKMINKATNEQEELKDKLIKFANATGKDLSQEIALCDKKIVELKDFISSIGQLSEAELSVLDQKLSLGKSLSSLNNQTSFLSSPNLVENQNKLQGQLDGLLKNLSDVTAQKDTMKPEEFEAQIKILLDKIKQCKADLAELGKQLEAKAVSQDKPKTQGSTEDLEAKILDFTTKLATLESDKANMSEEDYQAKVTELKQAIADSRASLEELKQELDTLEATKNTEEKPEVKAGEVSQDQSQVDKLDASQEEITTGIDNTDDEVETEPLDETPLEATKNTEGKPEVKADEVKTSAQKLDFSTAPKIELSKESLESVKAYLDLMEEKLNGLLNVDPHKAIKQSSQALIVNYRFPEQTEQADLSAILGKADIKTEFIDKAIALKSALTESPLIPDKLKTAMTDFQTQFRADADKLEKLNLACLAVDLGETEEEIQELLTKTLGQEGTDSLGEDFIKSLMDLKLNSTEQSLNLLSSITDISSDNVQTEIKQALSMIETESTRFYATGEYIHTALHSPIEVGTLIEAKIRGISPEELSPITIDANLQGEPQVMNEGRIDEVKVCQYKTGDGQELSFNFRSETTALQLSSSKPTSFDGYAGGIFPNSTIIATNNVAKLLGSESAMQKMEIGSLQGQFGTFTQIPTGQNPSDAEPTLLELTNSFSQSQKTALGLSLLQELGKLEWTDLLTGQTDRHSNSYSIDVNQDSGEVRISANLGSNFSDFLHGTDTVVLKGSEDQTLDLRQSGFDVSTITDKLPISHLAKPTYITTEMYDKLMAISPESYAEMLKGKLEDKAIDAAVQRLENAQAHAELLKQGGLCFDQGELGKPETFAKIQQGLEGITSNSLQQSLLERDFSSLTAQIFTANK